MTGEASEGFRAGEGHDLTYFLMSSIWAKNTVQEGRVESEEHCGSYRYDHDGRRWQLRWGEVAGEVRSGQIPDILSKANRIC